MSKLRKRLACVALFLGIVAAVGTPAAAFKPVVRVSVNHKTLVTVCIDVRMNCKPVTLFPR